MNDMKFTTAGDYMADVNFVSSDIREDVPSGNYLTKARDRWRESNVDLAHDEQGGGL